MEHIIEGLVSDYDSGKLTRRKLIRSLAITAATTAASRVGLAQAAATPDKNPLTVVAFNHVSYLAQDFKKTVDFYDSLFGGMRRYHLTATSCDLAFGPALGPYMVIRDVNSVKNRRSDSSNYIDHVAFQLESWDAPTVEAELKRRGLNPQPSGNPPTSFFTVDPNGVGVQISSGRNIDRVMMEP
jgi:hypothetical protein